MHYIEHAGLDKTGQDNLTGWKGAMASLWETEVLESKSQGTGEKPHNREEKNCRKPCGLS